MSALATCIATLAVAFPAQGPGPEGPKFASTSAAETSRQLTVMANLPKPTAFLPLYQVGVHRMKQESASVAFRWPVSVDGYDTGYGLMAGLRGGSNTTNERQSVIDLRFHTNKANKTHAMIMPIVPHAGDGPSLKFEVRIGNSTVERTVNGAGALMVTWKPSAAGYQGLSVKLISPGRYFMSQIQIKVAE